MSYDPGYIWTCALTGHRNLPDNFDNALLRDRLEALIQDNCGTFLCGMAFGFDQRALECLIDLKHKYRFTIEACIPYRGHEKSFPAGITYYRELLQWCDRKTVLAETYYHGCFLQRNRYMVDHCDAVFAYLTEKTGGTAYTVGFAKKKQKPVIFFHM